MRRSSLLNNRSRTSRSNVRRHERAAVKLVACCSGTAKCSRSSWRVVARRSCPTLATRPRSRADSSPASRSNWRRPFRGPLTPFPLPYSRSAPLMRRGKREKVEKSAARTGGNPGWGDQPRQVGEDDDQVVGPEWRCRGPPLARHRPGAPDGRSRNQEEPRQSAPLFGPPHRLSRCCVTASTTPSGGRPVGRSFQPDQVGSGSRAAS